MAKGYYSGGEAYFGEAPISDLITLRPVTMVVRLTIDFNCEPTVEARKVQPVAKLGVLPSKAQSFGFFAKLLPK